MPPFQLIFFFWYKKIELCKLKIRVQTPQKIGCSECLCCMLQLKIPLCIEFRISQGSGLSLIWKGQISRAVFTGGKVQIWFTKAQKVSFVPLWMCWVERLALIQNCTSLVQVKTVCGAHLKKKINKKCPALLEETWIIKVKLVHLLLVMFEAELFSLYKALISIEVIRSIVNKLLTLFFYWLVEKKSNGHSDWGHVWTRKLKIKPSLCPCVYVLSWLGPARRTCSRFVSVRHAIPFSHFSFYKVWKVRRHRNKQEPWRQAELGGNLLLGRYAKRGMPQHSWQRAHDSVDRPTTQSINSLACKYADSLRKNPTALVLHKSPDFKTKLKHLVDLAETPAVVLQKRVDLESAALTLM